MDPPERDDTNPAPAEGPKAEEKLPRPVGPDNAERLALSDFGTLASCGLP
jgi:hypothetical protein